MKPSELILNQDGSIYHLHLLPEQVAPIILTVGDPDRVVHVSRCFDHVEYKVQKREFITHTGRIGNQRVSVISTGIGPDNIDIVMNELDALFNIQMDTRSVKSELQQLTIIRIGTAGGLQAEIPVDSFIASAGAIGMDGLLQYYQYNSAAGMPIIDALKAHCLSEWTFPLEPYFAEADPGLIQLFHDGSYSGLTATNPGFYGPQGRQLRAQVKAPRYLDLLQTFDFQGKKILNLEMETSAIYGLSNLLGHRAISLSVILANRALGQFSINPEKSVQKLIEHTLAKLDSLTA